jgi:uridine nucleosidase
MSTAATPRKVWLDCDPGHDDAIALLLALYLDQIDLVGISTVSISSLYHLRHSLITLQVNGNAPLIHTHANAAQLLALFRAPKDLPLHRGS